MKKCVEEYGLHHIGFVVNDRDAVVQEIRRLYGVQDWKNYEFRPGKAWCYGEEVKDYCLKIAMGTLAGGTCKMEVIEPVSAVGTHADVVQSGKGGLHHFAFQVADYEKWLAYYIDQGAEIVFESETEDEIIGFRRCIYVKNEELGCVYEIMEIPHFRK